MALILPLHAPLQQPQVGNKAFALHTMLAAGLPVPSGFVLPTDAWQATLAHNGDAALRAALAADSSPTQKHTAIMEAMADFTLPEALRKALESALRVDGLYAVRSSALQEDLDGLSFAGQYTSTLNVQGADALCAAVLACYRSLFSEEALSYLARNGLAAEAPGMAVVVQEMVPADYSGVAFTLNPLTGADTELFVELAPGPGPDIVEGRVQTLRYCHDWQLGQTLEAPPSSPLDNGCMAGLYDTLHAIQLLFGYPCDVEFSFAGGRLYILQARPVTKILYAGIDDIWTTADFRDGGVSAATCRPFMWSLYEYAWENSLRDFLLGNRLLPKRRMRRLGDMFYGRPYWNLSVVKEVMSRIPGYREREFDSEYGIRPAYEGDGQTTGFTLASLARFALAALFQAQLLKSRMQDAQRLRDELLGNCDALAFGLDGLSGEALEAAFVALVRQDYLRSEHTYFTQIFINTIHQSLFKDSIYKVVDNDGYFALIGGLQNVSHLRPFYAMWAATRRIKADPAAYQYWRHMNGPAIAADLAAGKTGHGLEELAAYLDEYGYHSEKELDVAYPDFREQPALVAEMFRQTLALDDRLGPEADAAKQQAAFLAQMDRLREALPPRRYKKLAAKIEKMRALLWWREEFRDVSTRHYHLIRRYTLRLAGEWVQAGKLASPDDIWYLKAFDIIDHIEGRATLAELHATLAARREYYSCYRNHQSENEIGAPLAAAPAPGSGSAALTGLGCNSGVVTGTARVIEGLEQIDRLQEGDILVTRFTDTGWTRKFALLGGIVTEYGGVLCHAAIVSREYGIPCIVCATGALKRIPDGARVTINGSSGEITLHKEA